MVTKISKVQQDSSIFIFGHYKCPFFNFGEWSWEKLSKILYILLIFLLKEITLQLWTFQMPIVNNIILLFLSIQCFLLVQFCKYIHL
jgi:hypothetical protein